MRQEKKPPQRLQIQGCVRVQNVQDQRRGHDFLSSSCPRGRGHPCADLSNMQFSVREHNAQAVTDSVHVRHEFVSVGIRFF